MRGAGGDALHRAARRPVCRRPGVAQTGARLCVRRRNHPASLVSACVAVITRRRPVALEGGGLRGVDGA